MSVARAKPPFEIKGWHVLAAMLSGFGLVIAVNVAFAVIAVSTFPGEDVRRSYLQGVQYNETLAARREQAALGWSASASLREQDGEAVLQVALRDRDGAALRAAEIAGALQWHTDAGLDRELTFTSRGAGVYEASLGALTSGRWRLRARAETPAGALDFESELRWPPSH